jgi:predicted amidophosphoribosyltransferase
VSIHQNILIRIAGAFKKALFPTRCLVCGSFFHVASNQSSCVAEEDLRSGNFPLFEKFMAPFLCRDCRHGFVPVDSPMCSVCGIMSRSREGEDHVCGACIAAPPKFGMARSLGVYEGTFLSVIHRMKYSGKVQVARPLGILLFFALLRYWGKKRIDLIVSVPLHYKKMRMRGLCPRQKKMDGAADRFRTKATTNQYQECFQCQRYLEN